jgi:hypothetical protein
MIKRREFVTFEPLPAVVGRTVRAMSAIVALLAPLLGDERKQAGVA